MPPRRTLRGRGIWSAIKNTLSKIHDIVRERKLLSRGLRIFNQDDLGRLAYQFGYGKRSRRTTKKRTYRGRSIFSAMVRPRIVLFRRN